MKRNYVWIFCCSITFLLLTACGSKTAEVPKATDEETVKEAVNQEEAEEAVQEQEEESQAYTIIYDADLSGKAVKACEKLQETLGEALELCADQDKSGAETAVREYEILLGSTNRPESAALTEGLGLMDYRIEAQGKKLVVAGGSSDAVIGAIAHLIWDEDFDLECIGEGYSASFDGADSREEYVADPDRFLCNWSYDFQTPQWMLDYEEKRTAFFDPDGRMMSSVHRGDAINYPENSIEGIISTIHMGADNVEIDVQRTKDGVLVLMHDTSLQRTTDWGKKCGKNGLPESANLADWTYEELLELRLKTRSGADTDYVIPTLKEALSVCNGRITVRLDKTESWDWDTEVYPIIRELGAWDTCLINFEFDLEKQERIMETIRTEGSQEPILFRFISQDNLDTWEGKVNEVLDKGYQPMVLYYVNKVSSLEVFVELAKPKLDVITDDVRIYMQVHMGAGGKETFEDFDFLVEHGVNTILVDNGLNLQKYIAQNCSPTPY